jgi:hypothetical protein
LSDPPAVQLLMERRGEQVALDLSQGKLLVLVRGQGQMGLVNLVGGT